jgi:hypothetical protein
MFFLSRHPNTMGGPEIEMFLTDLAVNGHVAASTQNQAFCALLFVVELPRLDALRARRPKRLPIVLSPVEVRQLLEAVQGGVFRLMAELCWGKPGQARTRRPPPTYILGRDTATSQKKPGQAGPGAKLAVEVEFLPQVL